MRHRLASTTSTLKTERPLLLHSSVWTPAMPSVSAMTGSMNSTMVEAPGASSVWARPDCPTSQPKVVSATAACEAIHGARRAYPTTSSARSLQTTNCFAMAAPTSVHLDALLDDAAVEEVHGAVRVAREPLV